MPKNVQTTTQLYSSDLYLHLQSNAQNSPSKTSIVHEPRTFRRSSWIQKSQRNHRLNCQHPLDHNKKKKKESSRKTIYFCFIDYTKGFDCIDRNKLWKILKEMGIPDHLTCLLRNPYAGQEAKVRTGHGTMKQFQIGKENSKAVYCHPAYLTYMQSTS